MKRPFIDARSDFGRLRGYWRLWRGRCPRCAQQYRGPRAYDCDVCDTVVALESFAQHYATCAINTAATRALWWFRFRTRHRLGVTRIESQSSPTHLTIGFRKHPWLPVGATIPAPPPPPPNETTTRGQPPPDRHDAADRLHDACATARVAAAIELPPPTPAPAPSSGSLGLLTLELCAKSGSTLIDRAIAAVILEKTSSVVMSVSEVMRKHRKGRDAIVADHAPSGQEPRSRDAEDESSNEPNTMSRRHTMSGESRLEDTRQFCSDLGHFVAELPAETPTANRLALERLVSQSGSLRVHVASLEREHGVLCWMAGRGCMRTVPGTCGDRFPEMTTAWCPVCLAQWCFVNKKPPPNPDQTKHPFVLAMRAQGAWIGHGIDETLLRRLRECIDECFLIESALVIVQETAGDLDALTKRLDELTK